MGSTRSDALRNVRTLPHVSAPDRTTNLAMLIGVAAIAVRLIAIDQPFIDQWSWRQSDAAAIARNFFQNGFHFMSPQIDWAGDQPGYVGTEFPMLPFIAALCYKFLGVHEWVGRIQAVALFALSLPFFFFLVRQVFDATAATWALLFYSFAPLGVMASRCFMSDMPSLSLSIAGLYLFRCWIENARSTSLCAGAALISLSVLIKAPTAIIGAPLAYLAFERFGFSAFRRLALWIFAAAALVPSAIWYWHAHTVAETFYPHHFFGAGGIHIENWSWYWNIAKRAFTEGLTPLLCVLALCGAVVARSTRTARVFYAWLGTMIVFIGAVGYGNRHPWYQLPLVPIGAAFAGCAAAFAAHRLARSWHIALSILLVAAFGGLAIGYGRPFYRTPAAHLRDAGLALKRMTDSRSLIVAADYGDPTLFYYAERKGWHFLEAGGIYNGHPTTSSDAIDDLESLRQRGATHLVFYSDTFWWLDYYKEFAARVSGSATLLEETPQYKIYRFNPR